MFRRSSSPMGPEVVGAPFRPKWPKLPSRKRFLAATGVICVVLVLGTLKSCLEYVRPNEFGIKEVKVGVKRGIQPNVYEAGLAFVMPFGVERIHHFPRGVQAIELTAFPEKDAPQSHSRYMDRVARIQTSDGFYVDVDITILYRIVDPYKLITTVGPGDLYLRNGILPRTEPILKQTFGELTTEDFYNSALRVEKGTKAEALFNSELEPKGMKVDRVLVRYFKYTEEIQKNIEAKKLQDQLVFKNKAEAKSAMEEASLKRVTQEGEMKVKVLLEEAQAYKITKEAERDLYKRKKEAEADLLVKLAEARRTEMKNSAMQVPGSERMVAMQMADVLQGIETIIVPAGGASGFNPMDLDAMVRLFGTEGASAFAGPVEPAAITPETPPAPPMPVPESPQPLPVPAPEPPPPPPMPESEAPAPSAPGAVNPQEVVQ